MNALQETALTLSDVSERPQECRGRRVFVLPEGMSGEQMRTTVAQYTVELRPQPILYVVEIPGVSGDRSVKQWIDNLDAPPPRRKVYYLQELVYQQHPPWLYPERRFGMHTFAAAIPVLAVFMLGLSRRIEAERFVRLSVAMFIAALALPVVDEFWGFLALPGSYIGTSELLYDNHWALGLASLLGAVANLLFAASYFVYRRSRRRNAANRFSRVAAIAAFCCAMVAILPLALEGELPIYLGYGVWAASMLALAFGANSPAFLNCSQLAEK